jgi:hypothetical protein
MIRRILFSGLVVTPLALALGCAADTQSTAPGPTGSGPDTNADNIADDLGRGADANGDGMVDQFDINNDGTPDGNGIDRNGDGVADALGLDTNCDGLIDSLDTNGDLQADLATSRGAATDGVVDCSRKGLGTGGGSGSGGAATGGAATGGAATGGGSATGGSTGPSQLGMVTTKSGAGTTTAQYHEDNVTRNGVGYKFITNGWGSGWQSHQISWNGTAFTVVSLNGSQGSDYSPAGYPTVFCGKYSNPPKTSVGSCGLPAAITSVQTLRTGLRWSGPAGGQYNVAWDIWLGNGGTLSSYLMVWLRDPPDQRPAGAAALSGATINGLPGNWTVWTGSVQTPAGNHPIVNYVAPEGADVHELEFDVMDVYNDAKSRGYNLPGSEILAVAIGFEVWNGPVANIAAEDFYVDVN